MFLGPKIFGGWPPQNLGPAL